MKKLVFLFICITVILNGNIYPQFPDSNYTNSDTVYEITEDTYHSGWCDRKASDCDHLSPEYTDHPWSELDHRCINNYKKIILTGQIWSTEPAFAISNGEASKHKY
jgi:hypothetical protein